MTNKFAYSIFLICCILNFTNINIVKGQNIILINEIEDVDSSFLLAREYAFNGSRDTSRAICYKILERAPSYDDVRILIGRTYTWDGEYSKARKEFKTVYDSSPDYYDLINAIIDLEKWSENYDKAIEYCMHGLSYYPFDSNFLYKKADILDSKKEYDLSLEIVDSLIFKYPKDTLFTNLKESILEHIEIQNDTIDTDSLFMQAREYAFNGKRDSSRILCQQILNKNPNYHEVRTLLGRTYLWDKKYNLAKKEFHKVLLDDSANYQAISASIDCENWSDDYDSALSFCNYGLFYHPNDCDFLYKKASVFDNQEEYDTALKVLKYLNTLCPEHEKGNSLLKNVKASNQKNSISLNYSFEYFGIPWNRRFHLTTLKYGHKFKKFSIIAKYYIGDMVFDSEHLLTKDIDGEPELDVYFDIWKDAYAWTSYGYSWNHNLFPRHRFGFEIYQSLPNAFETSLGIRYMQFYRDSDSSANNILIYTASVGKYIGNWWILLRTYISPKSYGVSNSFHLSFRRYFKHKDNYFSVVLSTGNSPDERINKIGDFDMLDSKRIRLGYKDKISSSFLYEIRVGYNYEEYKTDNNINNRNAYDASILLEYLF
ncbi:MAG: YaiO family outer membrane beta-barrel protein [Bacteroidota bacterium]|nr:YaiO family outer membrane beta-barrel protein [Bacteroidota bacterium]